MKKVHIKTIIVTALLTLFLGSCSDILDEQPRSSYEPGFFKSEKGVMQKLGGHPFYIKKLVAASKNYPSVKLLKIINILREYDLKSKGLGVSTMADSAELQKEMIYKILH